MSTRPFRRPRIRVQSDNVLGATRTIAQLAKDVTDIAKVPIASQVASLVLSLLEIAKEVNDNNDARVRLASTAATYLVELEPILAHWELEETVSGALMDRMERFYNTLLELKYELEVLRKRSILRRLWGKERIATALLDREKALHASYSALLMWTVADTNIAVRSFTQSSAAKAVAADYDEKIRFSSREVRLKGPVHGASGFLADAELAVARGQRVIVKRVGSLTERDQEARKWTKLWHSNLPHMIGHSKDTTETHFLLFIDDWFDTPKCTTQVGSVAAFLLEISRTDDAFSIANTLITFVNDAASAFRHMQRQLYLTEDETAFLATIARYTLSSNGRIIVTSPLQMIGKIGNGVSNRVYSSLFPLYGTSAGSMRRYLAKLDGSPAQASATKVLDGEQLEKWSLVDSVRLQARVLSDKVEKPQEYVMPETRWAFADYSLDVKPGNFGVFDPGEIQEYAFRRVASPFAALFSHESLHWMLDRNEVVFDVVQRKPMTWKLGRLTDRCIFFYEHQQRLTNDVNRAKRFLELSAPKDCGEDKLVFVVGCTRIHVYEYYLSSGSLEEQPMADVCAELRDPDNDDLCFSYCDPSVCPDFCPLGSHFGIHNDSTYIHIEYVIIPIGKGSATLETVKKQDLGHFRHREYESIVQRRHSDHDEGRPPWKEWP